MSDNIMSRERSSACQAWQFASFDKPVAPRELPTAAQMEEMQRQSREEGRAAGYQEGLKQAEQEAHRLRALLDGVQRDLARMDETIADQLLALALDISRRMLGEALKVRPELVLTVVQEAVRCLPDFENPVRVLLHPEDAALVQLHLAAQVAASGWLIVPDNSIARGGCKLATATAEIDATLPGRWTRVLAALGQNQDWLAA